MLNRYIESPETLKYRGCLNLDTLEEHTPMMLELRAGPCANGSLCQSAAAKAFSKLATEREQSWHLADQREALANSAGKMLRAYCVMSSSRS